ncbi:MAG: hypothetical protein M1829_001092 [Trizodia sp. TS-e1964]|nr:MAG: hypothetical protein M1829_001092 [Trizodia sp. TS-e1964]
MSTITATTWVPRGFAAPFPTKYKFDDAEFERISQLARLELDDAKEELEEAQRTKSVEADDGDVPMKDSDRSPRSPRSAQDDDDDLKEYNLEKYDTEGENDGAAESMGMFGNLKSLAYHESNTDDPYITLQEAENDEDEREELQILETDNLLLAGKVEDEVAHLEIYVYEDGADNLYVHHDIMLPAIPICIEWLDIPVGPITTDGNSRGNFAAIGTMDPDIEIWDLDVVDCMYPNAILGQGGEDGSKRKKKKKRRSKTSNDEYHVDAVLSLAANRLHRNLLASASADKTIKLWDLNSQKVAKSYCYHEDKVCSLAWHREEATVLLSGSYDRNVVVADMRAPEAMPSRWGVDSDVETVRWNPHDTNYFYVSTEKGSVYYFDARSAPKALSDSKAVWRLQAHDESVTSLDINLVIPGFLVTGSTDRIVKLWKIQESGPNLVVSRNLEIGKVFTTSFAPDQDVGFRLAVAGSKGVVQIWDTSTNSAVRRAFEGRAGPMGAEIKERLVTLDIDSSDDEEGGQEPGGETIEQQDGWESVEE